MLILVEMSPIKDQDGDQMNLLGGIIKHIFLYIYFSIFLNIFFINKYILYR